MRKTVKRKKRIRQAAALLLCFCLGAGSISSAGYASGGLNEAEVLLGEENGAVPGEEANVHKDGTAQGNAVAEENMPQPGASEDPEGNASQEDGGELIIDPEAQEAADNGQTLKESNGTEPESQAGTENGKEEGTPEPGAGEPVPEETVEVVSGEARPETPGARAYVKRGVVQMEDGSLRLKYEAEFQTEEDKETAAAVGLTAVFPDGLAWDRGSSDPYGQFGYAEARRGDRLWEDAVCADPEEFPDEGKYSSAVLWKPGKNVQEPDPFVYYAFLPEGAAAEAIALIDPVVFLCGGKLVHVEYDGGWEGMDRLTVKPGLEESEGQTGPDSAETETEGQTGPDSMETEDIPETEAPETEAVPETESKQETEAPETESEPETEAPETEAAPETESEQETEAPEMESEPETEVLETEAAPETEVPEAESEPETVAPETEIVPETEAPETESEPETEAPETETAPETENEPETEAPETEGEPETEVPETETEQETEIPETENAPGADAPETEAGMADPEQDPDDEPGSQDMEGLDGDVTDTLEISSNARDGMEGQLPEAIIELKRPDGFPAGMTGTLELLDGEEMEALIAGTDLEQAEGVMLRLSLEANGAACSIPGTEAAIRFADGVLDASYEDAGRLSVCREEGWEGLDVAYSHSDWPDSAAFCIDGGGILFFWMPSEDGMADGPEEDGPDMDADEAIPSVAAYQVYEILYADGEMAFQKSPYAEEGREAIEIYHDDGSAGTWAFDDKRSLITSVTFKDDVQLGSLKGIFQNCADLVSVDIGPFTASGVTEIASMFKGCGKLASVEGISGLDVSETWDMSEVFSSCGALRSIDLSGWDTSKAATMWCMFYGCDSLAELKLGQKFRFPEANAELTGFWEREGDGKNFTAQELMSNKPGDMAGTYAHPKVYEILYENGEMSIQRDSAADPSKGRVYQTYEDDGSNAGTWAFDADKGRIASVTFKDDVKLESLRGIFQNCANLASVNIGPYTASGVTEIASMFKGCGKLASVEGISGLDVSETWDMSEVFSSCGALRSIDLSGWDTAEATTMWCMFYACSSLSELKLGQKFRFPEANAELTGLWEREDDGESFTAQELMSNKPGDMAGTYAHPKVYEILYESGEMSIQRDSTADPSKGRVYQTYEDDGGNADTGSGWAFDAERDRIRSVTFRDDVRLQSLKQIFRNCRNLEEVSFGPFTASGVKTFSEMFEGCKALSLIEGLSGLDASKAADMGNMFSGCGSLASIEGLSGWDVSSVTYMGEMFRDCGALVSIDLAGWDTRSVQSVWAMFHGCDLLSELKLGRDFCFPQADAYLTGLWEREEDGALYTADELMSNRPADMAGTYSHPKVYEILYESGEMSVQRNAAADPSKGRVYKIYEDDGSKAAAGSGSWAFDDDRSRITSVTFKDNVKLQSLKWMFRNCQNLEAVNFGPFTAFGVRTLTGMFEGCNALSLIEGLSGLDVSQVTEMGNLFSGCGSLVSIEGLSNWDVSSVTYMGEMFRDCGALVSLDLAGWDTRSLTGMWAMFYDCGSLIKLALGPGFRFASADTLLAGSWEKKSDGTVYTAQELMERYAEGMADTYYRPARIAFNGCGGAVSPPGINGRLDMEIETLPEASREGYHFLGWFTKPDGQGEQLQAGGQATVPEYYAAWKPYTYTLRLHGQNALDEMMDVSLEFGQLYQLDGSLFQPDDGASFLVGWNTRADGTGEMFGPNARVSGLADQDGTTAHLYAIWGDPEDYATLSFETGGGSEVPPMRYRKGARVKVGTLPHSKLEGKSFDGWSLSEDGPDKLSGEYLELTGDTTLYAVWTDEVTVTFDPQEPGLDPVVCQVPIGRPLGTLPAFAQRDDHRELIGWFTEPAGGVQITPETELSEEKVFYAHWGWRPVFDADGGRFTGDAAYPFSEDTPQYQVNELPEAVRDGYTFLGWFLNDGTQVRQGDTLDLSQGSHIFARWESDAQVNLFLDPDGGSVNGSREGVTIKAYPGRPVGDLPVPERDGYVFLGWYDGEDEPCGRDTVFEGSQKLTARWAREVTATFKDGDETVAEHKLAEGGTLPSLPGAKKDGYILEGWYTGPDGTGEKLGTGTRILKDTVYYAKWESLYEDGSAGEAAYTYGIEWSSPSNENVDNVDGRLAFHPTDYNEQSALLHIHFQTNVEVQDRAIPKGAVRIRIPKHIWQDWDGNWTGTNNAEMLFQGNEYFSLEEDPEDPNYYILTNHSDIPGGAGIDATINYTVSPADVPGGGVDSAGNYVTDGLKYYERTFPVSITVDADPADGKADTDLKKDLSVEMHTRVQTDAYKQFGAVYYGWKDSWGIKPTDADEYFYIEWDLGETVNTTTNQPFTFSWTEENTVHDGTVVRIDGPAEVGPKGYETFGKTVVVKYPYTMMEQAADGELTVHNEAIVTEDWASGYRTSHRADASATVYVWKPGTPGIDKYTFDVQNMDSVSVPAQKPGGQEDILDDGEEVSLGWQIRYYGGTHTMPVWDRASETYRAQGRTISVTDGMEENILYSSGSADKKYYWDASTGNTPLSDEDYSLTSVRADITEYDARPLDADAREWSEPKEHGAKADYEGVDIYVRYKDTERLVFYRHADPGEQVELPEDARGIDVRHHSSFFWTEMTVSLGANLKPSRTVSRLFRQDVSMNATSIIKNWARCRIWDEGKEAPYYDAVTNAVAKDGASAVRQLWELDVSKTHQFLNKSVATESGLVYVDAQNGTQDAAMCLSGWLYNESGRVKPLQDGVFYDLLPQGTMVDPASVYGVWFEDNSWDSPSAPGKYANNYESEQGSGNRLPASCYDISFVNDWEGSHRTMMAIKFSLPEGARGNGVHMFYLLRTTYENIMKNGTTQENDAAFVNTTEFSGLPSGTAASIDILEAKEYFEGLDSRYEGRISYFEDSTHYSPVDITTWGFEKDVMGEKKSYSLQDTVLLNGAYTYRLVFSQGSQGDGSVTKGLVFFDVLEDGFYEGSEESPDGRDYVRSDWEGSFVDIDIEALKTLKVRADGKELCCAPTVWYSTRDKDLFADEKPALTEGDVWTRQKPESGVTAIAVDCSKSTDGSDFIIQGSIDPVEIFITMRAPANGELAETAARNRAMVYMTHSDQEGQEAPVMIDAGASVTLKDVNPELSKTSDPPSGTAEDPADVYADDPLTYILTVSNASTSSTLNDVVMEDELPPGFSVQTKDIKVRFNDEAAFTEVGRSPRVTLERDGRKLTFTFHTLYAGETAYISVTGTVPDWEGREGEQILKNQARIPSVNGARKEIVSETTYHKVVPVGFSIGKTGVGGLPLAGAAMQLWKKADGAKKGAPLDPETDTLVKDGEWVTDGTVKTFDGLSAGTYIIHEAKAPDGHFLAEDITVELDSHGNLKMDGSPVNGVTMEDSYTKARVAKVGPDGEPVTGAKLELYREADFDAAAGKPKDGKDPVASWVTDGSPYALEGILNWEEGYVLFEREAPEGYQAADPVPVRFDTENGDPQEYLEVRMVDPKKEPTEFKLPETGGPGSGNAMAIGSIALLLGAVLGALLKRRSYPRWK